MNPYSVIASDLIKLQTEQGDACPTFTWNGKVWLMLPGSAENNYPLRSGGMSFVFDLKFTIVVSQFLSAKILDAPALVKVMANTEFQYLGQDWKFVKGNILTGATMIDMMANSKNQNA